MSSWIAKEIATKRNNVVFKDADRLSTLRRSERMKERLGWRYDTLPLY